RDDRGERERRILAQRTGSESDISGEHRTSVSKRMWSRSRASVAAMMRITPPQFDTSGRRRVHRGRYNVNYRSQTAVVTPTQNPYTMCRTLGVSLSGANRAHVLRGPPSPSLVAVSHAHSSPPEP